MRYMKTLGHMAVVALALMTFTAGTASATTLSSGSTILPAGTEIKLSLKSGTTSEVTDTSGNLFFTCTESIISGKTEQETAATLSGKVTVTWGNCTNETITLNGGTLTILWTSGLNGTVKSDNREETTSDFFGTSCIYGTASTGTDLGQLIGTTSGDATLSINAVTERKVSNFLCPATLIWKASYAVTSPTPLAVTN